ncbi:MAG TPA: nodulation protein NfeD [Candidatus Acidoferrales bacterium]|nr:nodulation protein NfeD [Candidatus Acidoferrales bacterium]
MTRPALLRARGNTRQRTWRIDGTLSAVLAALLLVSVRPAPGQTSRAPAGPVNGPGARVVELHIDDQIEPVMAEYVDGGIDQAVQSGAKLILIIVNTPGGLGTSMREIVQHIIDSPVPVAVHVAPPGARAASAGFFILLSADVAAMAPGTHTGAASPLLAIGGMPLNVDESLRRKILNDATAYLRSFASRRGRNLALAEAAVTEGKAFTEKEALDGKLIDLLARTPEDLLRQLDGRTITRFDGSVVKLELREPVQTAIPMTTRQKFLARIVQPDVFFILLIVGVLGLYAEFTHPGLVAPGVVGGIALLLALYAMHILPINFTGLLLIVLALALFILEAKLASHGVLGIGGIVAMLLGALMLIRSPFTSAGVSLGVALGATVPFAILTVFLMRLVLRSRSWKQSTGPEQMIGAEGEVTDALEARGPDGTGRGMVLVHGELWRAMAQEKIPKGARVRVVKVDGLTLEVEPTQRRSGTGA